MWDVGAFGEDNDERAHLVRTALARATEKHGEPIDPSDAVLIGDTSAETRPMSCAPPGTCVLPDLADVGVLIKMVRTPGPDPTRPL